MPGIWSKLGSRVVYPEALGQGRGSLHRDAQIHKTSVLLTLNPQTKFTKGCYSSSHFFSLELNNLKFFSGCLSKIAIMFKIPYKYRYGTVLGV